MKPAAVRWQALWDVLDPQQAQYLAPSMMREKLMTAYGFPRGDQPIDHSSESAEEERDFAMACLRGEGGTEGQFQWESENLTSVLASEVGLLPPPADNDSPMRPWFGGDWASMAELVIYIAQSQLEGITKPWRKRPTELIRVYPVDWDTKTQTEGDLLKADIKLPNSQSQSIYLQRGARPGKPLESEWISLCVPSDKLWMISNQLPKGLESGIPDNLWNFIPSGEPGDEAT